MTVSDLSLSANPPVLRGLPFFGLMFDVHRDRLALMERLAHYGDVVRFNLANLTMYQVSHPDAIKRILQDNQHNYPKGSLFSMFRSMTGNGLLFSDGEFWLRQRRLMQPAFHARQISAYTGIMVSAARRTAERWQELAASGQPVDINQEMTNLTMQVVTQALFGASVDDHSHHIAAAITTLLDAIAFRFDVPFYPPVSFPTPRNRRFHQAVAVLDQTVFNIIEQRRRLPENETPNDLLGMLMAARDEDGQGMNPQQLRDEVLTLFAAGHETTANALTWAFYLLSTHPDEARRLREELDAVLAGRPPDGEDIPSLRYTRMVIDETLRLYPPAWSTNRQALAEDVLHGYRIPAGAIVSISPYAMHRHPAYWPRPERFNPMRFLPENIQTRPKFTYFPFGGGPHQCIGMGFALVEAVLVLATLCQRYQLHLAPGFQPVPRASVTLRPRDGMWMVIEEI